MIPLNAQRVRNNSGVNEKLTQAGSECMAQQRTQKRLNRVRGSRHTPYTRFEIDCIGVRFSFTSLSLMLKIQIIRR